MSPPNSDPRLSNVFVDTSAFYAVLVAEDRHNAQAVRAVERLIDQQSELLTSSFVLQETIALLQARVGLEAVREFTERVVTTLRVEWVEENDYRLAVASLLASENRSISLTDWTSFIIMRRLRIGHAFAYDDDFRRQGFSLI